MSVNAPLLILSALIWWTVINGTKIETLKKCCNLGINYADSGLKCTSFQPPIAGVLKQDESLCLNSVDMCCKKQYREKQCKIGESDAKAHKGCSKNENDIEGEFRKDCCEACELGLETGGSGQSCTSELGLGSLMDLAFETCCRESQATTVLTTTTTESITTLKEVNTSLPFTKSFEKYDGDVTPPPPTLEALCEILDPCAHICIPTGDSYKCACRKGFTLMADGISCKPMIQPTLQNCGVPDLCEHKCIDTGVAVKCACYKGYELHTDKRSCKDIDECALEIHDCGFNQICVNLDGDYDCEDVENPDGPGENVFDEKCPEGYKFAADRMVCDDIDECEIGLVCPKPSKCINFIGSFKCEDATPPQCPPGFSFKASIQTCDDIDECLTGQNDCNKDSQICLNTKGNYTCINKASKITCPPGFKKNLYTQQCEDIDECNENPELCDESEECINELGGHNCIPKPTSKLPTSLSSFFTPVSVINTTEKPRSQPSYTSTQIQTSQKPKLYESTHYTPKPSYLYPSINQAATCPTGYELSDKTNHCTDTNECLDKEICDSNQDCYNTVGSYICNCKNGFTKDYQTGACVDINECQVGQHDCREGQRCDNTIGSYLCSRTTGCGTGYTLNSATGLCEDDDECLLGLHNCHDLGPKFQCRNTAGSYRCERIKCIGDCYTKKVYTSTSFLPARVVPTHVYPIITQLKKCLPGYTMNQLGECQDINECESNPCKKGEKCLNLNGKYQCIPFIQCKSGYELNDAGNGCVDINECSRGVHKCKSSQICKNGEGYYICACPPGHKLNHENECEDINECELFRERICSSNSQCVNTVGSYKCECKEGFRETGQRCEDINECTETSGLCQQNCVNLWGSYRCSCKPGFTLSPDNRTCVDIDECEKFKDKYLCIGTCQNTPGSYTCKCPQGYRLGKDKRTCQDVDECQRNICRSPDDVCINTRGSYKCHSITCPPNYIKDAEHKSRCKRASNVCDIRDINCIRMPSQYSYHFVTFVSNLPIPDEGRIDFFQMKAPAWDGSSAMFNMDVTNIQCSQYNQPADQNYFRMKRDMNKVIVSLIRPILGPQVVQLQLQMELYMSGVFQGKVVSNVFVYVSEYEF